MTYSEICQQLSITKLNLKLALIHQYKSLKKSIDTNQFVLRYEKLSN